MPVESFTLRYATRFFLFFFKKSFFKKGGFMSAASTLFQLVSDPNGMFDGSVNGIAILKSVNTKVLPGEDGVAFANGLVDIARHGDLDNLQSFTVEATITPAQVGGA